MFSCLLFSPAEEVRKQAVCQDLQLIILNHCNNKQGAGAGPLSPYSPCHLISVPGASCHIAAKFNYYPKKKVEKLRLMCGIYSKLLCTIKVAALLHFFPQYFPRLLWGAICQRVNLTCFYFWLSNILKVNVNSKAITQECIFMGHRHKTQLS